MSATAVAGAVQGMGPWCMKHLWNVVGGGTAAADPVITWLTLRDGDRLSLCTDGLTHTCTDRQLGRILQDEPNTAECVQRLVPRAKGDGGTDNIAAVLADFRFDSTAALRQTVVIEQSKSASAMDPATAFRPPRRIAAAWRDPRR